MPETTLTARDYNGHVPDDTPPRCPYSRMLSYITWQYSISLDYDGLTALMDEVFAVWDSLKLDATNEEIGNGFERLVGHVAELRQWTGWAGVPGIYTGTVAP
jgi:hypothetical protein